MKFRGAAICSEFFRRANPTFQGSKGLYDRAERDGSRRRSTMTFLGPRAGVGFCGSLALRERGALGSSHKVTGDEAEMTEISCL